MHEVKDQAKIESIASSPGKAWVKVRDRFGVERKLKITPVDTRAVVIVFTSDADETEAFEEGHRLRNRIDSSKHGALTLPSATHSRAMPRS